MKLLFLTLISALPSIVLTDPQKRWKDGCNRAIYTLSNNPDGAHVLALAIDEYSGKVSSPVLTPTGGKGLLGTIVGPPFGPAGSPSGPDSLFGQGCVQVSGKYLFVVNAGSNTLSMFIIHGNDPLHPKLVGQPASTLGEFPMSVTYSAQLKMACVLNGGAKNGVACFTVSDHGLQAVGPLRPLAELKSTTPPAGPTDASTNIQFNPDSSAVLVTITGNPFTPAPGFFYAFPIKTGHVSTTPVVTTLSSIFVQFSINFLSPTTALVTDASYGASIVTVAPNLTILETHKTVIPNQGASCWGAYSPRLDSAYVIDNAQPNVTVLDPTTGAIKAVIQYESDAVGATDTVIDRHWMYIAAGSSDVLVIDLAADGGGKEEQLFSVAGFGPAYQWQGMGLFTRCPGEIGEFPEE